LMSVERTRILLISSEEDLAELAQKALENLGYKVLVATSGGMALRMFSSPVPFDLIIIDGEIPEVSAADLAKAFQQIQPGIPLILFTDYPEVYAREETGGTGVRAVITKSAKLEELTKSVRRLLES
jgi:CheY-like chemotaxis protein